MEPGTIKSATGRHHHHSPTISKTKHRIPFLSSILAALVVVVFALLGLVELHHNQRPVLPWWPPLLSSSSSPPSNARILRRYSLTVRSRWMNPGNSELLSFLCLVSFFLFFFLFFFFFLFSNERIPYPNKGIHHNTVYIVFTPSPYFSAMNNNRSNSAGALD